MLENLNETETMYIKHSVSLIGTAGLTYLSKGENPSEAEPMYIKHSVDRYVRPPVPINDTLCLMYIGSASLGFSPFDRYVRPAVPINDTLCLMYITGCLAYLPEGGGTGTKQRLCTLNTVYH
jgi:hypothetical protein